MSYRLVLGHCRMFSRYTMIFYATSGESYQIEASLADEVRLTRISWLPILGSKGKELVAVVFNGRVRALYPDPMEAIEKYPEGGYFVSQDAPPEWYYAR